MPITLSQALITEKNKVEAAESWLVLVRLTSPDSVTDMFLVRNNEDVTINGQLYQAFPFDLSEVTETSSGSLPSFTLKVSNIDRVIQQYIEQDATYGSGWGVLVSVVSSTQIGGITVPEMEFDATSLNVVCDKMYANFSCGVANPMMQQFPSQRYSTGFCQRTFKDGISDAEVAAGAVRVACTYGGLDQECSKTLSACQAKFPITANEFRRWVTIAGVDYNIGLPFLAFNGIASRAIY